MGSVKQEAAPYGQAGILTATGWEAFKATDRRLVRCGLTVYGAGMATRVVFAVLTWIAIAAVSVCVDSHFQLRPGWRFSVRILGLAGTGLAGFLLTRRYFHYLPNRRRLARELEQGIPGLSNRFISSVEFGRELRRRHGGYLRLFSPLLVNRFYEQTAGHPFPGFWTHVLIRSRLVFAGVGAGLAILFLLALPRFTPLDWRGALNVYLAPFQRPPWRSETLILVEPGDTDIPAGSTLDVQVQVIDGYGETPVLFFATTEGTPDQVRLRKGEDETYSHRFENIQDPTDYWVRVRKTTTRRFSIRPLLPILLTRLNVTCVYPQYTGLQPRHAEEGDGDIEGYLGTRCRILAEFNEEADHAELKFEFPPRESPQSVQKMAQIETQWLGDFEVRTSGSYWISASWEEGLPGRSEAFRITAVRDASPTVRILSPPAVVDLGTHPYPDYLKSDEGEPILPIEYYATDDLGLRSIRLLVGNEEGKTITTIPVRQFESPETLCHETFPFRLKPYLHGEDVLLHVEVADSLAADPNGAPRIYSKEEILSHTVLSRPIRITWERPDQQVSQESSARETDVSSPSESSDARQQVSKDLREMRENQEEQNRTLEMLINIGRGSPRDGKEGEQKESSGSSASPEGQAGSEAGKSEPGTAASESGNLEASPQGQPGSHQADAKGVPEPQGSQSEREKLASRQQGLAEKSLELAETAGALAQSLENSLKEGFGNSPGEGRADRSREDSSEDTTAQPGPEEREALADLANKLKKVAKEMGRDLVQEGEKTRWGVARLMEVNADRIRNEDDERALTEGRKIVEQMGKMIDSLERPEPVPLAQPPPLEIVKEEDSLTQAEKEASDEPPQGNRQEPGPPAHGDPQEGSEEVTSPYGAAGDDRTSPYGLGAPSDGVNDGTGGGFSRVSLPGPVPLLFSPGRPPADPAHSGAKEDTAGEASEGIRVPDAYRELVPQYFHRLAEQSE